MGTIQELFKVFNVKFIGARDRQDFQLMFLSNYYISIYKSPLGHKVGEGWQGFKISILNGITSIGTQVLADKGAHKCVFSSLNSDFSSS